MDITAGLAWSKGVTKARGPFHSTCSACGRRFLQSEYDDHRLTCKPKLLASAGSELPPRQPPELLLKVEQLETLPPAERERVEKDFAKILQAEVALFERVRGQLGSVWNRNFAIAALNSELRQFPRQTRRVLKHRLDKDGYERFFGSVEGSGS